MTPEEFVKDKSMPDTHRLVMAWLLSVNDQLQRSGHIVQDEDDNTVSEVDVTVYEPNVGDLHHIWFPKWSKPLEKPLVDLAFVLEQMAARGTPTELVIDVSFENGAPECTIDTTDDIEEIRRVLSTFHFFRLEEHVSLYSIKGV